MLDLNELRRRLAAQVAAAVYALGYGTPPVGADGHTDHELLLELDLLERTAPASPDLLVESAARLSKSSCAFDVEVYGHNIAEGRQLIMAQYAVLIYANDSAHRPNHTAEETESCDRHAEELQRTGAMVAAWAFTPRNMATSIRGDTITDGPFVDAKDIVAGIYFLQAPDLDSALAIAKLNPACQEGGGVEVRPVDSGGVAQHKAA